ncbi:MAG: hypothetical protein FJ144_06535 [Deltaproteobacteria bacterium]|nr:hypothetical protein [Deltaproteobacteria bacterium]
MPSPLAYLRRLRYGPTGSIVVVHTGATRLVSGVLKRLADLFPGARVTVLLRGEDAALATALRADEVTVVRWEERAAIVRGLRQRSFDVIVMQLSRGGAQGLRTLPFLLRGRSIVAFNDSLDHFPINVFRVGDLARHFGVGAHGAGAVLTPFVFAYLLCSNAWLHVRGAWRRRRRERIAEGAPAPRRVVEAPSTPATPPARARAAASSEGG